jgi:hypothetical protein
LIEDLAAQNTQINKLTDQLRERKQLTDQSTRKDAGATGPRIDAALPLPANPTVKDKDPAGKTPAAPQPFSTRVLTHFPAVTEFMNRLRTPRVIEEVWLFNAAYYLDSNPDVAREKVDPREHFLRHGWRERRSPHPIFDLIWRTTPTSPMRGSTRWCISSLMVPRRDEAPTGFLIWRTTSGKIRM